MSQTSIDFSNGRWGWKPKTSARSGLEIQRDLEVHDGCLQEDGKNWVIEKVDLD